MQKGHADSIRDVVFSPDGKLIASCGLDRFIRIWDAKSGTELRVLGGGKDESLEHVSSIAFSPDGRSLADSAGRLWDVATGKLLNKTPLALCYSVAFHPDGKSWSCGHSTATDRC